VIESQLDRIERKVDAMYIKVELLGTVQARHDERIKRNEETLSKHDTKAWAVIGVVLSCILGVFSNRVFR
jgi:hypothetical protein